ncbi:ABC transporter permease [Amycolatopsis taiwanensis]|uniref:ABC3 transporter permease C-terminal domain-containing protein n=1 Tax=Amycolatopsis taiwanensis TaxID=342230 RepID=A0A9W6R8S7_9PSEU|nr:FtsX-like permease family protein [Amycolatopsis taiwanensis]GLY70978.1 hypothetical protein Atai01_75970 [Amycolatopsis taiwanensis]
MGRTLLICRLVLRDLRRHPVAAVVFLLGITAATTALSVGLTLNGATSTLYQQTREQTLGPDVVAVSGDATADDLAGLTKLEHAPGVVAHGGPYPVIEATSTAHGRAVGTMVLGRAVVPASIDRPLVTTGSWIQPDGVVVERGFAEAIEVRVGDRITVAGKEFPVVGVAVTAANAVYPQGLLTGGGGPTEHGAGLVWLTEDDVRSLPSPQTSAYYLMDLRLADPTATEEFIDYFRNPAFPVNFFTWQDLADTDSGLLRSTQPALVVGGWLLAALAVCCVAGLMAGRAAGQVRRIGLLKAVGAGPGLVAAVVLAEYVVLALAADGLGLLIGWLMAPALSDPSSGMVDSALPLTPGTIVGVAFAALTVAIVATLGPALRAANTTTVHALAGGAHPPLHRAARTPASLRLPTSLLLGLRLIARRPRHAVLTAAGMATTSVTITALLTLSAQPRHGYDLGPSTLTNLRDQANSRVLLAVTFAMIALAVVNTVVITWSTAQDARRSLAVARTLGATPAQVTGALCVAQLLPALPGALIGVPIGVALSWIFSIGTMTLPSVWWLLAAALATLLGVTVFTAAPARIEASRPVVDILNAETA